MANESNSHAPFRIVREANRKILLWFLLALGVLCLTAAFVLCWYRGVAASTLFMIPSLAFFREACKVGLAANPTHVGDVLEKLVTRLMRLRS